MSSEILLYQTDDGQPKIEVRLQEDTVWLTQAQMAELFGKDKRTISEHIMNVFNEGNVYGCCSLPLGVCVQQLLYHVGISTAHIHHPQLFVWAKNHLPQQILYHC